MAAMLVCLVLFVMVGGCSSDPEGRSAPPGLTIGTETSLRKLHPESRDFTTGEMLRLAAARREAESAQILLLAARPGIRIESVTASPLTSAAGAEIAAQHILVERVGYVTTRKPGYEVEYVGEWPDPRFPFEPFALEPDRLQPLWVTVTVPPEAEPGQYAGRIALTTGDGDVIQVSIALNVWDFELPLCTRLKTAFGTWYTRYVAEWYGWNTVPDTYLMKMYDLMFAHRLNPMSQYDRDMWPPVRHLDYCAEKGLNTISMRATGTAKPEEFQIVRRNMAELAARGVVDGAYVCGFDEWPKEKYPYILETLAAWQKAVPDVNIMAIVPPNDMLAEVVDIWPVCPVHYDPAGVNYDPEAQRLMQERIAAGDEVWCYIGTSNRPPFANWWIDSAATEARVAFWQAYQHGMTGFLYYATSIWSSNMRAEPKYHFDTMHADQDALASLAEGKRWPEVPWNTFTFYNYNGDGQLIYPGPNETPYASIRLANIRDGVEDYEYLAMLADLTAQLRARLPGSELIARAEALLAVNPELAADWTHFTDSPAVIEAERARVAACIVAVKEVLNDE